MAKLKFFWAGMDVTGEFYPGGKATWTDPEYPPEFDLHTLKVGSVELPEEFRDVVTSELYDVLLEAAAEADTDAQEAAEAYREDMGRPEIDPDSADYLEDR